MTKTALLLLALYGLGDDSFEVRQASQRYLAASGYAVVPLNRLAPYLTDDLQTKATLKKLERRHYAGLPSDFNDLPALSVLHPDAAPWYRGGHLAPRFTGPLLVGWKRNYYEIHIIAGKYRVVYFKEPRGSSSLEDYPPLSSYFRRALKLLQPRGSIPRQRNLFIPNPPSPTFLDYQHAMTALFLEDARAWCVPRSALSAVLRFMAWRERSLIDKYQRLKG
jgi:hypothetical protein